MKGQGLLLLSLFVLGACQPGLDHQPKIKDFGSERFFGPGEGPRTPVEGTVMRDAELEAPAPPPVTMEFLSRGQERFNIYCSVCHGLDGNGHGPAVQRGFPAPPTYHQDRLRNAPLTHYYDVMTNGFGRMFSYAGRVEPEDRWAIAAYIRALQLSQNASVEDLSPEDLAKLQSETGEGGGR